MKDDNLLELSRSANVAQFASFSPSGRPRVAVLREPVDLDRVSSDALLERLLESSSDHRINLRTFLESGENRSLPFEMGIQSLEEARARVKAFNALGYHVICNESIDLHDGGVSGVALDGFVEFAPGKTPRAVEEAGVARLSRDIAIRILSIVYQVAIDIPDSTGQRIEFSVHPRKRGVRSGHVIVWASQTAAWTSPTPPPMWPNDFSRHLGDKVFGLLVADAYGAPVPFTTVTPRNVAPFTFGKRTYTGDWWIRTAPAIPEGGLFPTLRGWRDPYALLSQTPASDHIASVLSQEGVPPLFSGGAYVDLHGEMQVSGVCGDGENYMQGEQPAEALPNRVASAVKSLLAGLRETIGDVRLEWVYDGEQAWIVQCHAGRWPVHGLVIRDGECSNWVEIDASMKLNELRESLRRLPEQTGVIVRGEFGFASHKMELIIETGRPARLAG